MLEGKGEDKIARETNEQVLECTEEKTTLINNILRRKVNWIGHTLRRNCPLHDEKNVNYKPEGRRNIGRPLTRWEDDFREEGTGQGA